MAEQFTRTIGRLARGLVSSISVAKRSLPVPVSPVGGTVALVGATWSANPSTR